MPTPFSIYSLTSSSLILSEAALVSRLLSEDAKAPFSPALVTAAARAVAALCRGRVRDEGSGKEEKKEISGIMGIIEE